MIRTRLFAAIAAGAVLSLASAAQAEDFPATPMNPNGFSMPVMQPMQPAAAQPAPPPAEMSKPMTKKKMTARQKKKMMMKQEAMPAPAAK